MQIQCVKCGARGEVDATTTLEALAASDAWRREHVCGGEGERDAVDADRERRVRRT